MRQQNPETPTQEGTGIVNTSSFSDARTPHFREVFLFSGNLQEYSPPQRKPQTARIKYILVDLPDHRSLIGLIP